jgi:hypothetical protein
MMEEIKMEPLEMDEATKMVCYKLYTSGADVS